MNYSLTDSGSFIRVTSDTGSSMVHKSFIRAVKPAGDMLVKLEMEDSLHNLYFNYMNVTNPTTWSNVELSDLIAGWAFNT